MGEYKLIDYFDVWGNVTDGWEVNNLCDTGYNVMISDDAGDEDIIQYLKQINYLAPEATTENIVIEGDDMYMELFQKYDMLPLGRLERKAN